MALKLSNNAKGLLALAISDSDTSLTLDAGHGSRFPALGSGDWFPITVVRASDPSKFEIMRCTGRSGDTLTVVRGQEGTAAITFSAGDVVELRLTAGTLEENFPQVVGRAAKQLSFGVIDDSMGRPELEFANASKKVKALANKGSLGETNLDLATDTGIYSQPADADARSELNYPTNRAGSLLSSRDGVGVQLYLSYQSEAFLRGRNEEGVFSSWRRFAFADEIGELKGKRMLFLEPTAPPGWTQDTSINDRVLRLVNSAGGSVGGNWIFGGLGVGVSVGATTLSVSQMPFHKHDLYVQQAHDNRWPRNNSGVQGAEIDKGGMSWVSTPVAGVGSGFSHTHSATVTLTHDGTWRPAYIDVIACKKD